MPKNIRYFVSPNCLQIRAVTLVKAFMAVDEFALIINFCEGYES